MSLIRLLVHWVSSVLRYVVCLLAYVVLIQNTAQLLGTAFSFVTLCTALNAAVSSVYLCVVVFRDVAVLTALSRLHVFGSSTNSRGSWASWLPALAV